MNITLYDTALIILALLTAVYSAFINRLRSKISSYRLQTFALAILVLLKAGPANSWFYGIASILVVQTIVISRLLAYVTNAEERQPGQSWLSAQWKRSNTIKARSAWLEYDPEHDPKTNIVRANPLTSLIFSSAFIIFAYFVAFYVAQSLVTSNSKIAPQLPGSTLVYGLGASLALLLVGLFIMINAQEILSQTMGLLVMENGLFLAAVIVIPTDNPLLAEAFWVTMFAWYTLTWVILIIFIPRLRQFSRSIYVKDQMSLKE